MERRGSRQADYWNMAGDYVINRDLKDQHIGRMPKVGLYDDKYRENYTDEIYDDLFTKQKKVQKTLDMHIDELVKKIDENQKKGGGQGDKDGEGKDKGPVPLTKEEKEQLKDEIKNAVIQAAQVAGAGNVPGGVKRLIKDLTEPKMDWRTMLDQQITSVIKNDFTWMKPSRKAWDAKQ